MYYRPVLHRRLRRFRDAVDGLNRRRLTIVLTCLLVVGITLLISSNYLPTRLTLKVGDVVPETVVSPRTITFEDKAATEELKLQAAAQVQPIYITNPTTLANVTNDIRTLFARVRAVRGVEIDGVSSSLRYPSSEDVARVKEVAPASVDDQSISYLLSASDDLLSELEQEVNSSLRIIYAQNVTESNLESRKALLGSMVDSVLIPLEAQVALAGIASAYLRPNVVLDGEATEARRQEAESAVTPVAVTLLKGETVVSAGGIVTDRDVLALGNLGLVGTESNWKIWTGVFVTVLLEMLVILLFLRRFGRGILADNNLLLSGATLLLLFTALARIGAAAPFSPYVIPLIGLGLTASMVLGARAAQIMVAVTAVNVGLVTGLQLEFALVCLVAGSAAIYMVSHVSERFELLGAGVYSTGVCMVAVFAAELLREVPVPEALESTLWGLASGVVGLVIAFTLLEVFEVAFNLTTPLRLLELANPAQPLLRRLMQEAPGTYNHSIMVGNLAESAAEEVGADPLLTRVGAYYHDIGKINRPEYFIENQLHMRNPHDSLSPNLSKLAITAHVGDGVELAKEYGLPSPVIDIIRQHHGNSLLSYFYYKAKQSSHGDVTEESYRYGEERPTSREAAIIMLADSVEAAVKAMEHPTMKKIQVLIRDIFRQKMEDGQLDRSQLTFGDLSKIARVFENGLKGVVGHRVAYPGQSEIGRQVSRGAARVVAGGAGPEIPLRAGPKPQLQSVPSVARRLDERDASPKESDVFDRPPAEET